MKLAKNMLLTLLVSLLILSFNSCSDDDDGDDNPLAPTSNNKMSADISGFIDSDFEAVVVNHQESPTVGLTVISGYAGTASNTDNIILQLYELESGPSTTDLSSIFTSITFMHYSGDSVNRLEAHEGSIEITRNDTDVIEGTFWANAGSEDNLTEITNGSFYCDKK